MLKEAIYVGCTILELSKLEMYKCHYGSMKNNVSIFKLMYSDTDSFILRLVKIFMK